IFGHSATPTQAGALPNSLSPETAKGAHGDNLILARLARFSWSNSLVFENKEVYLGPTACVALPSQVPEGEPAQRRTQQGRRVGNRRPVIVGLAGRCVAARSVAIAMRCRALR